MIKVENLTKIYKIPHEKRNTVFASFINIFRPLKYDVIQAVDNVSFGVDEGEFIGIIGKNGSGKSTLLKLLAGILIPNYGSIQISGNIIPFLSLGLGFSRNLTGRDNIYLNGMLLGLTKREIDNNFDKIVEFSELDNFIDTRLKNYSSGMNLRLAFSIAIHAKGDVFLVDEIIAVGDAKFKRKCMNVFRNFKNQGKTILFVSHSLDTIREMCDKTILLKKGKIAEFGDPKKVIEEYLES